MSPISTDLTLAMVPNIKFGMSGSVAFRASGTEPLIRCYIEAKSAAQMKKLRQACQDLLKG
jgi:phosphomannomutase